MCIPQISINCKMLSYQYGPTFLKNAFSTLLNQCLVELRQFWRRKGVKHSISMVFHTNNPFGECSLHFITTEGTSKQKNVCIKIITQPGFAIQYSICLHYALHELLYVCRERWMYPTFNISLGHNIVNFATISRDLLHSKCHNQTGLYCRVAWWKHFLSASLLWILQKRSKRAIFSGGDHWGDWTVWPQFQVSCLEETSHYSSHVQ